MRQQTHQHRAAVYIFLTTLLFTVLIEQTVAAPLSSESDYVVNENSSSNETSEAITVTFSQKDVIIGVGEEATLNFRLSGQFADPAIFLYFTYQEEAGGIVSSQRRPIIRDLADVTPPEANQSATSPVYFTVIGVAAGHVIVGINSTSPEFENRRDRFVRIRVIRSHFIDWVNYAFGILYVICWSASYYPQTWLNYRRKSVVGLNFDFVSLNIVGFVSYSVFNVGLYWVQPLQEMYYAQHPRGVIPVQLADCIFALHCLIITIVQGIQCLIYERGGQKTSWPGRILLGCMICFLTVCLVLAWAWPGCGLSWLQYVYFASYVKLAVTLTKYTPQAYMNYRRRSTQGWSIGQVHLDFAGGILSIGQMLLLAFNYSDWDAILGDPTKLGLGVVSIAYDCLFFVQHYHLYGPHAGESAGTEEFTGSGLVSINHEKAKGDRSQLL